MTSLIDQLLKKPLYLVGIGAVLHLGYLGCLIVFLGANATQLGGSFAFSVLVAMIAFFIQLLIDRRS